MGLISYIKQLWDATTFVNPTRMNHMEDGIEAACNGVDNLADVAKTGSYKDLEDKPTIPTISDASTSEKGIVQLTSDLTGDSESLAATQKAVSELNSALSDLFSHNISNSFTINRNNYADVFTAPKDCLAYVNMNICTNNNTNNNGAAIIRIGKKNLSNAYSDVAKHTSSTSPQTTTLNDISLSTIISLKAGEKIGLYVGFSGNASVYASYYSISY